MMKINYEHNLAFSADEIWEMTDKKDYNDDLWGHYMSMLYFVDFWDYKNCNGYHPPHISRRALACISLSLPALAYTNPYKTKEIGFYLHLIAKNLGNARLEDPYHAFGSDNGILIYRGLAAAFYQMVSGNQMYVELFHEIAEKIYDKICENRISNQKTVGIETITGHFDTLLNAMALMVLDLHDHFFHTAYMDVKEEVLQMIKKCLTDSYTGLYYDSYHTGSLGFKGELLSENEIWHGRDIKASVNGIALSFMHYFQKEETEMAWKYYKEKFRGELLSYTAEDLSKYTGISYITALNPNADAYYGAMLAAKEFDDKAFFEMLLHHLYEISGVRLAEGKIWFDNLGDYAELHGFYIMQAKSHVKWEKIFNHDWENFFSYDYNIVR